MLLFHAEDLHILLFSAQLDSQRVIMLWNQDVRRGAADKNAFAVLKLEKQRIRHVHRV